MQKSYTLNVASDSRAPQRPRLDAPNFGAPGPRRRGSAPQVPRKTDGYWRARAARMRALAIAEDDPATAQLLTDLAADYEELAQRGGREIEERKPPSKEQRE